MPSMRSIVAHMSRSALRHVAHAYELTVADARKTDELQQALLRGLKAPADEWLVSLPAKELKALVQALALTPEKANKAAYIAALAHPPAPAKRAAPAAKPRAAASRKDSKKAVAKAAEPAVASRAPAKPPKAGAKARGKPAATDAAPAEDNAPAKDNAPAPKHMLSWSDAVARAAKRGQSAATMLGQPAPQTGAPQKGQCSGCAQTIEVQACSIHSCDHFFVAHMGRKICAECMFERNNMSVDAFHERLRDDWLCPRCGETVTRL